MTPYYPWHINSFILWKNWLFLGSPFISLWFGKGINKKIVHMNWFLLKVSLSLYRNYAEPIYFLTMAAHKSFLEKNLWEKIFHWWYFSASDFSFLSWRHINTHKLSTDWKGLFTFLIRHKTTIYPLQASSSCRLITKAKIWVDRAENKKYKA